VATIVHCVAAALAASRLVTKGSPVPSVRIPETI
jgi:hypothetical protein